MIAHTVRSSWQTILADLSLILFMVTACALANTPDGPLGSDSEGPADPHATARPGQSSIPQPPVQAPPGHALSIQALARAEPVGVWRPAVGAPTLPQWLSEVARDPRLRLTITVHFAPGGRDAAWVQAQRLDHAAGVHGETARIVVEPGLPAGANAVVGYDADAGSGTLLAHGGA